MSHNPYKFRQTVPHSANCHAKTWPHKWALYFPITRLTGLNTRGCGRGATAWFCLLCNDPACEGRAIVAESVLYAVTEYGRRRNGHKRKDGA